MKLLSETRSTSDGSWLSLLCRELADAVELPGIVENISFEAHPVSGEVEFGDVEKALYRKLDQETLQSRTTLPDLNLVVLYTWCTNDTEGGEDGWRISELKPWRKSHDDATRWYPTFSEAEEKYVIDTEQSSRSIQNGETRLNGKSWATNKESEDDDDDAYWSQYDQRQSETPAHRSTPSPQAQRKMNGTHHDQQVQEEEGKEDEYYSRYNTVQPAMDSQDPTEDDQATGESSLYGDILLRQHTQVPLSKVNTEQIVHTRPSSSSSSSVAKLEQSAAYQSQAEIAIQQHISSTIKNLHRLARGAGIERSEFCRLIQNELDCLSLLDEE